MISVRYAFRMSEIAIRHHFRPGDVGRIVWLHGTLYAKECGWDHRFEAYVATPLGEFANRTSPRERIWLVDADGELSGCVAIVEAGDREAQLRWLLLAPNLRGLGLGRRLVEETITFSRAAGYESVFLWTVKELTAAGRLYASLGFRVTFEEVHDLWGGPVTEQKHALRL